MYEIIDKGDWTLDFMLDAIKNSYVDVTGDGKTEDDTYGFLFDDARLIDAFWSAFDLTCVSRDSDNNPVLDIDIGKMNSVCDAIRALERDYRYVYCYDTVKKAEEGLVCEDLSLEKFAADGTMFWLSNIYMTERKTMRNMETEYGIISLPKWDDAQEDYYSFNNTFAVYAIPGTNKNPTVASAALEALASDSYRYVAPVYYNRVLKGRYTTDIESSKMLDKIVETTTLDFGWIYDREISKIAEESLRYFIREESYSFSTFWKQNNKRYSKAFNTLIDKYKKMAAEGGY